MRVFDSDRLQHQLSPSLSERRCTASTVSLLPHRPLRRPFSSAEFFPPTLRPAHATEAVCADSRESASESEISIDKARDNIGGREAAFVIREANSKEFEDVGWLRATAYYEARPPGGRFQRTYTRQFAQTEARSLCQRTRPPGNAEAPETVCLVAAVPSGAQDDCAAREHIVGTLDIRPPAKANGLHPEGVPECGSGAEGEEADGVYLLNVAVDPDWRGRGCGKVMMRAAEKLIRERWGAKRIFAHVATANQAALSLYINFGYSRFDPPSKGQNVLLYKVL